MKYIKIIAISSSLVGSTCKLKIKAQWENLWIGRTPVDPELIVAAKNCSIHGSSDPHQRALFPIPLSRTELN